MMGNSSFQLWCLAVTLCPMQSTPQQHHTMQSVVEGALRFQREVHPTRADLFSALADGQAPEVLFVSCSDSRVVPELLTQRDPGELFVIRNAGNLVPAYSASPGGEAASIEYAVAALGVRDIVVCGHSGCGAMTAVAAGTDPALPAVESWLHHATPPKVAGASAPHAPTPAEIDELARENVRLQLTNLTTHPSVAAGLAENRLRLHGWLYDIATGQVHALDPGTGRFLALIDA